MELVITIQYYVTMYIGYPFLETVYQYHPLYHSSPHLASHAIHSLSPSMSISVCSISFCILKAPVPFRPLPPCVVYCYNLYRLHTNSSLFLPTLTPPSFIFPTLVTHRSHTYSTLSHISHTCDSSFPHLPHPVSYFPHLWLIVPTPTPLWHIHPSLYFYYIYS